MSEWLKRICPYCGREYQHTQYYVPATCSSFDCVHRHIHRNDLRRTASDEKEKGDNAR